jgi:hypothetical protein
VVLCPARLASLLLLRMVAMQLPLLLLRLLLLPLSVTVADTLALLLLLRWRAVPLLQGRHRLRHRLRDRCANALGWTLPLAAWGQLSGHSVALLSGAWRARRAGSVGRDGKVGRVEMLGRAGSGAAVDSQGISAGADSQISDT